MLDYLGLSGNSPDNINESLNDNRMFKANEKVDAQYDA